MSSKKIKQVLALIAMAIGFVVPVWGNIAYTIRSIHVAGHTILDHDKIVALSGFQVGSTIDFQSKAVQKAIRKICKEESIKSVEVYLLDKDDKAALASIMIKVEAYPSFINYSIEGLRKKEQKSLPKL